MSVNNTSPASFIGGTWERIQDRFLIGASNSKAAGSTGGAATINLAHNHTVNAHNHSLPANTGSHTLTVDEMPSHHHDINGGYGSGTSKDGLIYGGNLGHYGIHSAGYSDTTFIQNTGGGKGHSHSIGGNTGNASPVTDIKLSNVQGILPPYLSVYMWKRTA